MTDRTDLRTASDVMLFSHEELACKATGEVRLAAGFAEHLMGLRLAYAMPMIVNSCCRSLLHNAAEDGHPRSLHVFDLPYHDIDGTAAIDVRVVHPDARPLLVRLALEQGWSVIARRDFDHLDRRDLVGLPQRVFGY